jgi:hypothetical protein
VLTRSFEKAFGRLAKRHAAQAERRAQVERELGQTVQRLDRLVDALADGSLPQQEIKARLAAETTRKKILAGQLDQ